MNCLLYVLKRLDHIETSFDMSSFIFDQKQQLIEVAVIWPAEGALKVADLIAEAVVIVLMLLS